MFELVYVAGSRDERIGETLKAIEEAEKIKDNFSRMSHLVTPASSETVRFHPALSSFLPFPL